MKVFAIFLSFALIASISAQGDYLRNMMMLRMLGGMGNGGGSSSGSSASSSRGGLFSGGGFPQAAMLFGDRMQDIWMCNMMFGGSSSTRSICMARALQ